jgi:hypothetical protein
VNRGISIIALVLMGSLPALAGEAQYTGPGSNPQVLSAERACEPQIGQAQKGLVMLRLSADDSRGKQIVRELQLARQAMEQGNLQGCVSHVGNASGMEH